MIEEAITRLRRGELIPVIVQDEKSKEVLMLAWTNEEAFTISQKSGRSTFWSRSREIIWSKGETSGNFQEIVEIKYDCDGDALLFLVKSHGPACHTGESTCFYRSLEAL
jgi:phosphoribosyl-AMP cyclohydrolase